MMAYRYNYAMVGPPDLREVPHPEITHLAAQSVMVAYRYNYAMEGPPDLRTVA